MVTKASIKSSFDPNDKCPRAYILLFVIVIYIPIKHLKLATGMNRHTSSRKLSDC